ncbi:hypothetical protein TNCV_2747791 [Trichonephila clavipes]|nr:hypothetical protein TNCV_2747791 [Trichonephila clavipes]
MAILITRIIAHLMRRLKAIIYEISVDSLEDYIARLSIKDTSVSKISVILGMFSQSLFQCCQTFIPAGSRSFEHLLNISDAFDDYDFVNK